MGQIALLVLFSISLIGCFSSDKEDEHAHHKNHAEHESKTPDFDSGSSIFNIESEWINRSGEKKKLSDLAGKVHLISMVYTSCEYVCPRIVADLKRIEKTLGSDGTKVNFLLVSFDTERDKPKVLQAYSKEKKIAKPNWFFFSGPKDSVMELAAVLGVKYKKRPDGEFSHSNIISVLDKNGILRYQQVGLNQDPENSILHIKEWINK